MGWSVEPAQFSLLSALIRRPGARQSTLGGALGLDKTTMSRNLRLMNKNGWIEPVPSDDNRERGYRLTRSGKKIISTMKPGWRRAQKRLRAELKPGEWENMMEVLGSVAGAVLRAQQNRAPH
jgi:DNA-binding MarR family transcriptional regulator